MGTLRAACASSPPWPSAAPASPRRRQRGGRRPGTRWVASRKAEARRRRADRRSRGRPGGLPLGRAVEALLAATARRASVGCRRDGVDAAPVVVVSHCWEGAGHPDPGGRTLGSVAAELGRQFATFVAWGFGDVGVFIDWASIYQDTVEFERTESEAASAERAIGAMPMLFAHRESTVLLIADRSRLEPPRVHRGWPFYEETLTKLFKEAPPPKRYKLPEGPTHLWPKVLRVSDDADPLANDWKAQGPPIAPTEFHAHMTKKVFGREGDREKLLTGYRTTIEHGFSGLERLGLSRRGWSDADVIAFSVAIKEVECPHVTELDLSANDFTAKGVEAVGAAIAAGALHSLRVLDLSDCSGMKSVPETIAQLAERRCSSSTGIASPRSQATLPRWRGSSCTSRTARSCSPMPRRSRCCRTACRSWRTRKRNDPATTRAV